MMQTEKSGWFDRASASAFTGIPIYSIRTKWEPLLPASAVRREGRGRSAKVFLLGPELLRVIIDDAAASDPLMTGGDSPAQERYRMAKAQLAELELGERRRALMPRVIVHEWLGKLSDVLRQFGHRLAVDPANREYLDDLNETLHSFGVAARQAFGPQNEVKGIDHE